MGGGDVSGVASADVKKLRQRFDELKEKLKQMPVRKLTVVQMVEAMEYVSGERDPTDRMTESAVQDRIDAMQRLWDAGRLEGGKKW